MRSTAALAGLDQALGELERGATGRLSDGDAAPAGDVVSALDPTFRAQELSFVAAQIARNIELAAAAERRSWLDRSSGGARAGSRAAGVGAGAGRLAPRAALGLAAQQPARRRRARRSRCWSRP